MERVLKKWRGQMKTGKCGVSLRPLVGLLPAGGWKFFGTRSVYYLICPNKLYENQLFSDTHT